jgi:hypothetical protein
MIKILIGLLATVFMQLFLLHNAAANTRSVEAVQEIGIAVNNIHKATRQYQQIMGVSKWEYQDLYNADGDKKYPSVRLARAQFGDKRIALIQPLAGPSLVKSHLEKHGPSIFHIGIKGENDALAAYPSHSVTDGIGAKAKWIDTYADFGVNIFSYDPNTALTSWGSTGNNKTPTVTDDNQLFQLGIVSRDLAKTAMSYFEQLGIGPWLVVDFKGEHITNAQYLGAKGAVKPHIKVAYAMWGNLQLELLMPISGPSPHRDFLITRGFGAHHVSYGPIKNHDAVVRALTEKGIAIQMQSDNGGEGRTATYMDTLDQLGFVLELTRPFKGAGTLPIAGTIPARVQ